MRYHIQRVANCYRCPHYIPAAWDPGRCEAKGRRLLPLAVDGKIPRWCPLPGRLDKALREAHGPNVS